MPVCHVGFRTLEEALIHNLYNSYHTYMPSRYNSPVPSTLMYILHGCQTNFTHATLHQCCYCKSCYTYLSTVTLCQCCNINVQLFYTILVILTCFLHVILLCLLHVISLHVEREHGKIIVFNPNGTGVRILT